MRTDYTVKELATLCNVSEQAIRYYLAQNDCAKVASKWKPTQDELAALFSHYGVDVATLAQEEQETCAKDTKNAHVVAQDTQDDETPGQTAYFKAKAEQLEIRLQEQKEILEKALERSDDEIKYLREQLKAVNAKNEKLLLENDAIKNQMLLNAASKQDQEQEDNVINIPPIQEQEIEDSAAIIEDIQEQEIEEVEETPEDIQEQANVMEDFKKQLRGMSIFEFFRFRKTL